MKLLTAAVTAALLATSSLVGAASSFNTTTDTAFLDVADPLTWVVNYAASSGTGLVGVNSLIQFNYLGANAGQTQYNFSYRILNTSTGAGALSELSSFGFDSTGVETGASAPAGSRFAAGINTNGQFNGLGTRDVCLYAGPNCNGGASNGVAVSEGIYGPGFFSLTYGAPLASQTLGNFVARWQSTIVGGDGSASGTGEIIPGGTPTPFDVTPPVPEPATWMMMLLGFGVIGSALRRTRRNALMQLA
jgi:hypothetical protein